MSNTERLKRFMAGEGSERLQWFFSGHPVMTEPSQQKAFEEDQQLFTGFRYRTSPVLHHNPHIEIQQWEEGEVTVTETRTERGILRGCQKLSHPVEYPVKSLQDLRILIEIERGTQVSLDQEILRDYDPIVDRISINPSPVQRLLEYDMGVETFWLLTYDHPEAIGELLNAMMANYLHECQLVAELPVVAVRPVENTSTTYISPTYYKKLSLPQIRSMVKTFHSHGKFVAVHMCGLLKDLIEYFPDTGMDGIHSLTPPPVGNTPYELAWEVLGDDFPIEGRLGTTCWLGKSREEIQTYARGLISEERIRRSPFILEVHCDGIKDIPYEAYRTVREALNALFRPAKGD